ncbi:MAG: mandelate racemase [Anaerolineae bacterium]|nr:mandelate racemase [Anaerolineae bacterium]
MTTITGVTTRDARFALQPGEGVDAVHANPQYSYAVTLLQTDSGHSGTGIALTLGGGNDLVCSAIIALAQPLIGQEIEALMATFGRVFKQIADEPQYRWLGPHKGVVHLALASITNACFDLWAKVRGMPLWRLLLNLDAEAVVSLLDLSYLEDVLIREDALALLRSHQPTRSQRESVLKTGYPGYDTSVGWFNYADHEVHERARQALAQGFNALKLKVGSPDSTRDIRRAHMLRELAGDDASIMLDANQQWTLPQALRICLELASMSPFWIEEPTHPDDVLAHQTLARAIAPLKLALGEHVSHRVLFKNFLQAGAAGFIQVDCTRVGGVSEFITVSLLARLFHVPVVPHVGDMGQIHQHLVLFNHIALGHERLFLEHIPHLRQHFVHPAQVSGGVYAVPQEPGSSSDLFI